MKFVRRNLLQKVVRLSIGKLDWISFVKFTPTRFVGYRIIISRQRVSTVKRDTFWNWEIEYCLAAAVLKGRIIFTFYYRRHSRMMCSRIEKYSTLKSRNVSLYDWMDGGGGFPQMQTNCRVLSMFYRISSEYLHFGSNCPNPSETLGKTFWNELPKLRVVDQLLGVRILGWST